MPVKELGALSRCSHFHSCSAPLCPINGGSHRKGEATCLLLREAAKADGKAALVADYGEDTASWLMSQFESLVRRFPALRRPLRRAELSQSKRVIARRLVRP